MLPLCRTLRRAASTWRWPGSKPFADPKDLIADLAGAIAAERPREAMFYFEFAEGCRKAGRLDDAIRAYRQTTERRPDFVAAYVAWSELLLSRGEAGRAIQVLEEALKSAPDEPDLLNSLAVSYARQERFRESVSLLRRAVAVNPDLPVSWLNLGVGLHQQRDYREAAAAYRNALRLQPDFTRARSYLRNLVNSSGPLP